MSNDRNLIERLLIECAHVSRSVPAETGVGFRVSKPAGADESLSIIYHIDAKTEPPLFKRTDPRPDYLVFHASAAGMILTIVEMKGTAPKNQRHGLEQIQFFASHLRNALREHLPPQVCPHLQGVLLTPFGVQVPRDELARIASRGLVICQLQYQHHAELQPYVSRRLTLADTYRHVTIRHGRQNDLAPLERLLVSHAEKRRRSDAFLRARWAPGQPGIYVNFDGAHLLPGAHASRYLVLAGDRKRIDLGIRCPNGALTKFLRNQLEAQLGLPAARQIFKLLAIEG